MILATKSYCCEYAEKISTGCEFLSGIGNTGQEFVGSPALLSGSIFSVKSSPALLVPKIFVFRSQRWIMPAPKMSHALR
jgi:hypothetical protein